MHQLLFIFGGLQQVECIEEGIDVQNRGYEQSMMMKQMGAVPLNRRKKVKWRLQRWIRPPFWCLILFGQKIPADRLGGCWVTHMLNTHNLLKFRATKFVLKRFLFTTYFLRMAILTNVSHFLKSLAYKFNKWFSVIYIDVPHVCHASNDI